MNVGYYFHVPGVFAGEGRIHVPAQLGLFVEELARQAGRVTLYLHGTEPTGAEDHVLDSSRIRCVHMGPVRSAPSRLLFPHRSSRPFRPSTDAVDVMLIRGPSPLLPYLTGASKPVPVVLYLQGDYGTAATSPLMPWWRRGLIELWKLVYAAQQNRVVAATPVLVNSSTLGRSISPRAPHVREVLSSLVAESAVAGGPVPWAGDDASSRDGVRLVYAGRIVEEKGLLVLTEAIAILVGRGIDVHCDLVGATTDAAFTAQLEAAIERSGLADRVRLRGYVPVGPQMFSIFREADAFVLASFHEGFPYVILEAMAAGLPVVSTAVGGIPDRVADTALLVAPRSAVAVADAVERLVCDPDLRKRIAESGWVWARKQTLEKSCATVLAHLREALEHRD